MLETTNEQPKKAYSVKETSEMTSLSKSFLRNEITVGNLKVKRFGRRVLILDGDLKNYLEDKENWQPTNSNGEKTIEVKK